MKFTPIEQRSDEWYAKRLGKPTASQFGRIITPGGKPSASAALYQSELIAERIFKQPMGKDISKIPAVAQGRETEPEAFAALEKRIGPIEPGGFFTDDAERYGASPDGLLIKDNRRELVEIKCPDSIPQHFRNLLFGVSDDYRAQIQGQLFISGYDAVHFWSYRADCPPHYQRVGRDDPYIRALDNILDQFVDELEANYQRALKLWEAWEI